MGKTWRKSINKYRAQRVTTPEGTWASIKEYHRHCELQMLQKAGQITDLQEQVRYQLLPAQRINGKLAERAVWYVADFVYRDNKGNLVVEDTKGMRTREYVIKRKLMLYIHNIRIEEL